MVMIEKVTVGDWSFGGAHLPDVLMSFVASVVLAKGILDDRSRARFVDLAHKAVNDSPPGEKRRITTSFLINEIEDRMWGVNGSL